MRRVEIQLTSILDRGRIGGAGWDVSDSAWSSISASWPWEGEREDVGGLQQLIDHLVNQLHVFGTAQSVRVAVFAEGAAAQEAIDAGADLVGGDDLVAQVKESEGSGIESGLLLCH